MYSRRGRLLLAGRDPPTAAAPPRLLRLLVTGVVLGSVGWALATRDELVLVLVAGAGLVAGFVLSGRRLDRQRAGTASTAR